VGAVADGILYGEVGRRAGRDEQLSLEMDGESNQRAKIKKQRYRSKIKK